MGLVDIQHGLARNATTAWRWRRSLAWGPQSALSSHEFLLDLPLVEQVPAPPRHPWFDLHPDLVDAILELGSVPMRERVLKRGGVRSNLAALAVFIFTELLEFLHVRLF